MLFVRFVQGLNVTTPLARCFDKFTELEPLDDIVCPTCHNTSLSKAFTLWRLPPVLIVQLKRFRFDRTSRRKLNNQIDFPMEDLDLFDYLAPGRQRSLSRYELILYIIIPTDIIRCVCERVLLFVGFMYVFESPLIYMFVFSLFHRSRAATVDTTVNESCHNGTSVTQELSFTATHVYSMELARTALYGDTDTPNTDESTAVLPTLERDEMLCTHYDLYSVVHHAGALGGGHYATTARALNMQVPKSKPIASADTFAEADAGGGDASISTKALDEQWYCFNDNLVSTIDKSEVCSPSAYLLFYMRKDMRQGDVLSLLRRQLNDPVIHTETPHVNVFRSVSSDIADSKVQDKNLQQEDDQESVHSGDTAVTEDDEQNEGDEGVAEELITSDLAPQQSTSRAASYVISPEQVTLRTTTVPTTNNITASSSGGGGGGGGGGGVIPTSTNNGFSGFTDGEEAATVSQITKKSVANGSGGGVASAKEDGDCVIS